MSGTNFFVSLFAAVFLCSGILFIVMSGIGYSYFYNDWVISYPTVNAKLLFGCGIGVGIYLLCAYMFFLFQTRNYCNWFVTFPVSIVMLGLYLGYTSPNTKDKYLSSWERDWNPSLPLFTQIQLEHECCGWTNASDRGIERCPDDFESGCEPLARQYIEARLHDLFVSFIVILSLITVSVCTMLIGTWCEDEEVIAECCVLLNEIR
jgi:hypothetical protein